MPSQHKYSDFSLGPVDSKNCIELARQAEALAAEYSRTKRQIDFDLARAAQKRDNLLKSYTGKALDSIRGVAQEEFAADRRKIIQASEAKRYEHLGKLKEINALAESSAKLFGNPLAALTAFKAGDIGRSRMVQEFNLLPPAALRTTAQVAAANKDVMMAAACVIVNESRESKDQSFDSAGLSSHVLQDDCDKAMGALKIAARTFEDTFRVDRELVSGKTDSLLAIGRGLKDRKEPPKTLDEVESSEAA